MNTIDRIGHVLIKLKTVRDNWEELGNAEGTKVEIGDMIYNPASGVCDNCNLDLLPDYVLTPMVNGWLYNHNKEFFHEKSYFIDGFGEFHFTKNLYNNPKRLHFVNWCIEYLECELLKFRTTNA